MGSSFKLLGGRKAGDVFTDVDNPIAGVMIGILATVLVQSSSTSTSIVVSMVGSDIISVKTAIPIIMGANIGTSVTNTLVSLTHIRSAEEFQLAFSGSTIHDFFNFLSVLILLPMELLTGFMKWLSGMLTREFTGESGTNWEGPIKRIVSPLTKKILSVDKSKIKAIAKGETVEGSLIKGGIFKDSSLSDNAVGGICLTMSLIILCVALVLLVRFLKKVLQTRIGDWLRRSLNVHGIVSILIGCGITILVQSSSVTTSALVPLVAVGTIDLEHLFPLTMGANIGTTVTALLASLTQDSADALQIALVHLCFNIMGILIWYPIPFMRGIPVWLARNLGKEVRKKRYLAILYIIVVFFVIPLNLIGFSEGEPWLLWVGLAINIAVGVGFFGIVWVYRHRSHWIPCINLRRPEPRLQAYSSRMTPGSSLSISVTEITEL
jgi:sodium-dependent phosphate cotransporter